MRRFLAIGMVALAMAACAPATPPAKTEAPKAEAGAVAAKPVVADGWIAATAEGVKVSAGYLTLTNPGASADRLVSAATPAAGRTELHIMQTGEGGVMKMRMAETGIELPAGGELRFAPGGTHLMLFDLPAPLKEGATTPVTLTFEKAGAITVDFAIKPRSAGAKPAGHGGH